MKKILILIVFVFIYVIINSVVVYGKENIDLKLYKNEIAITFIDKNILVTNNENTLILLNNTSNIVERFGNINVINVNNIDINFKYNKIYDKSDILIDNISYEINKEYIKIKYNKYSFLINLNNNGLIESNFIYLYNNNNLKDIIISEYTDLIFVDEKINIPTSLIEDVYSKWIDIYRLKEREFTVLKINNEDFKVTVIPY